MKKFLCRNWFPICLAILLLVSLTFQFSDLLYGLQLEGRYQVGDPDSLLFLRHYEQSLLRDEQIKFDEYGTYPTKSLINYPPLHMKLLVGVTHLFFRFFPDYKGQTEMIVGWLPPFTGWLLAILIVLFAWRKTSNKALVLLLAYACIPGRVSSMNFRFLRIDYHFLNAFFIWVWLYSSWEFVEKHSSGFAILGVGASTAFLMTWSGTPMFYGIVTCYGLYLWVIGLPLKDRFNEFASMTMIASSSLVAIYLVKYDNFSSAIGEFGWFQPVCIGFGGMVLFLLPKIEKYFEGSFKKRFSFLLVIISFAIILFFALFPEQLVGGYTFLTTSDPLMQSVSELGSGINLRNLMSHPKNLISPLLEFGVFFILFPIVICFPAPGLFEGSGKIVKDWLVIMGLMGLYSFRFYRWLSVGIGFLCGIALYSLFTLAWKSLRVKKGFNWKVVFLLLPFMIGHFVASYPYFFRFSVISKSQVDSFEWIRKNTPETGGYFNSSSPEYCFYCYWDEGNKIAYYSQRPTLTNNSMRGYAKMASILTAENELDAYQFCRKFGVKYLFISDRILEDKIIKFIRAYKNRKELPGVEYRFFPEFKDEPHKKGDFKKTFHYWVGRNCAIRPTEGFRDPASHFRIVYSSEQENRYTTPEILLYEVVPGAEISGQADPGTKVKVSLECVFEKATQPYVRESTVDETGGFSFFVPYATGTSLGRVSTADFYKISFFRNGTFVKASAFVREKDIHGGLRVNLNVVDQ